MSETIFWLLRSLDQSLNNNLCSFKLYFLSVFLISSSTSIKDIEKMQVAFFDENANGFGLLLKKWNLPIMEVYRVKLLVLENFKTRICLNPEYSKNMFQLRSNSLQKINDLKIYWKTKVKKFVGIQKLTWYELLI